MKKITAFLLFSTLSMASFGFQNTEQPKLVVGVVVDQMRYEYLHRFADHYGEGGFKRLLREGFSMRNAHYNYIPTKTAPGHSSIYSGATPSVHGVIGNEWYDRKTKSRVSCVVDRTEQTVGSTSSRGQASPRWLLASTIGDELKLSNQMQSKVISISIKDRGAVLPGGHAADAAYWYDVETGDFVTSTYYMEELPQWVKQYNAKKLSDKYLNSTWNNKLPMSQYAPSRIDNYTAESNLLNEPTPTFPHRIGALQIIESKKYNVLKNTPFTNTMTTDMAIEALKHEQLGKQSTTDLLAISYSATDYIGHEFGPHSVEVQDTYLRLDDEIERLLNTLDQTVGKGNYTLFLTADHAVAAMPEYMNEKKIPAGSFHSGKLVTRLNEYLSNEYGEGKYIEYTINLQLYFNWKTVNDKKINAQAFFQKCYQYLMTEPGIMRAYGANSLINGSYGEAGVKGSLIRGFNHKRSGDIMLVLEPNWFDDLWGDAADHGSNYNYDTHVPMVFFGNGIPQGSSVKYHPITDIAPTISTMLNIKIPNGSSGQPIEELFEK